MKIVDQSYERNMYSNLPSDDDQYTKQLVHSEKKIY